MLFAHTEYAESINCADHSKNFIITNSTPPDAHCSLGGVVMSASVAIIIHGSAKYECGTCDIHGCMNHIAAAHTSA